MEIKDRAIEINTTGVFRTRAKDYASLVKMRLTIMVVFSAGIGYIIAAPQLAMNANLGILLLAGFLITGSANGINQMIERKLDAMMTRTNNRPLAAGRISLTEAAIVTISMGVGGAILLGYYLNPLSAFVGVLSLITYAFIYTPLKQYTRLSVVAGAFPGAAPPMIGYVAMTGTIDELCLLLFAIQFIWQFPHFWAVAWMLDDDYKLAGFRLLPSLKGRGQETSRFILASAVLLIPIAVYFFVAGYIGVVSGILVLAFTCLFIYQSYNLFRQNNLKAAKTLMFGSFYYLPIVQILILIGVLF